MIVDCNPEFGIELALALPYAYWLHKQGKLEKVITRDTISAVKDLGDDRGAKNLNYHMYAKFSPLGSKIKGLWEVYQQMNTPQYKRAVTMYKKKKR